MKDFINSYNTCTLCTGSGNYVRATPMEYIFYDNCFYFIGQGGKKFIGILQNPNVSMCIYDEYTEMQTLKGLQISGTSEILSINSDEYKNILKLKNINNNIEEFPININVLKVKPDTYEFLNWEFKDFDVNIKQIYKTVKNI